MIRVEVYYNMGGMNYFTGSSEARGLFLSVSPLHVKERSTSYLGFSGYKTLVKRMSRFSAKVLENYTPEQSLVDKLVQSVVEKNKLKIIES